MTRVGLWQLVAGPTAWALHFLSCYVTVAIHCAKAAGVAPLGGARSALWVYTAVAVAAIAAFAWRGWRAQRAEARPLPHHAGTPAARNRFLGRVMLLLCMVSAAAVAYTSLAFAVIGSCR